MGKFVGVGGGDDVAAGNFEYVVFGKGEDVSIGRNVDLIHVFAGNLDVVDGNRFAEIFMNDESHETQLVRIEGEVPFSLIDFRAWEFADQGRSRRWVGQVKVGFLERDQCDICRVVIGAGHTGRHGLRSRGSGKDCQLKPHIDESASRTDG